MINADDRLRTRHSSLNSTCPPRLTLRNRRRRAGGRHRRGPGFPVRPLKLSRPRVRLGDGRRGLAAPPAHGPAAHQQRDHRRHQGGHNDWFALHLAYNSRPGRRRANPIPRFAARPGTTRRRSGPRGPGSLRTRGLDLIGARELGATPLPTVYARPTRALLTALQARRHANRDETQPPNPATFIVPHPPRRRTYRKLWVQWSVADHSAIQAPPPRPFPPSPTPESHTAKTTSPPARRCPSARGRSTARTPGRRPSAR